MTAPSTETEHLVVGEKNRRYSLARMSVGRPVTVVMVLLALLVVGYIAYSRIPLSMHPEGWEHDWLFINVYWKHASPADVQRAFMPYSEDALGALNWVKYLETVCAHAQFHAKLQCRPNTDTDRARRELWEVVDQLRSRWPENVDANVVHFQGSNAGVMWVSARYDGDIRYANYLLETQVRPRLERIQGVANVEIYGPGRDEVVIELDEDKVRGHGVDVAEYLRLLRDQNFRLSGGRLVEGGRQLQVRSQGRFSSLEEIRKLTLHDRENLRLGDVASVQLKPEKRRSINRVDGQQLLWIAVRRTSNGNLVAISQAAREVLREASERPEFADFDVEIVWDQSEHVLQSINNLKSSLMWGGLFAGIVLFLFVRTLRMTLVISAAVPLSLLATVIAIYLIGWTLNSANMLGLMLSLGLVMDNAIVIVENIFHKRQSGVPAREASIQGAGEVGLAVTMATLTTVVVFLPLILMSDDQDFVFSMLRIGLPVVFGLLASLIIALVLIPLAVERLGIRGRRTEGGGIVKLRSRYLHWLRWVLDHRLDASILVLAVMATITYPQTRVARTDAQEGGRSNIRMMFNFPTGNTLEQTDRFMRAVEDTIANHQFEYGYEHMHMWCQNWEGNVNLVFPTEKDLTWYRVAFDHVLEWLDLMESPYMEADAIVADIKERISLPAGTHLIANYRWGDALEAADQDASITVHLYGHDLDVLTRLSEEVERRLDRIPGLLSVYTDMDRGTPEMQVRVDLEKLRRYGISPREISESLLGRLSGFEPGRFSVGNGSQLQMRLQLEEADHYGLRELRNVTFASDEERLIPLDAIATFHAKRALGKIRRQDHKTLIKVTALATKDEAKELFAQVDKAMEGLAMPRGYRWDKGARYERLVEADRSQEFAIIMAVVCVFLLMGVLFESFVMPLSVIVSVPFAFLGVYWVLYLTGTPMDFLSQLGTVILIGVVVNNAIVFIDLANRLRAQGTEIREALVEAGRQRFRPILMTTFTTVCGLIPMAVGNTKVAGTGYAPLGRTIMGGLLASMFLTLVIVPLCYTLFEDLRIAVRRLVRSGVSRPRAGRAEVGATDNR